VMNYDGRPKIPSPLLSQLPAVRAEVNVIAGHEHGVG
jgi:hypothetical protein